MYKLRQYYYANKKKIWRIILIIALVLILIQIANNLSKDNKYSAQKVLDVPKGDIKYDEINLESNKEILTGNNNSSKDLEKLNIIDTFFKYINAEKYEEAYGLITDDCKKEIFTSQNDFEKTYISKIKEKGDKNIIEVEKWKDDTYKVSISGDFLTSGDTKQLSIEDYVTIEKDKLNINNFIGNTKLYGQKDIGICNIKILEEKQYMDYTVISIEVSNKTTDKIFLDDLSKYDNMYIKDQRGYKYIAYSNELTKSDVLIYPGETKKIDIKYYLKNSSNIDIDKVFFKKILQSYEKENITGEIENVEISVKKVK